MLWVTFMPLAEFSVKHLSSPCRALGCTPFVLVGYIHLLSEWLCHFYIHIIHTCYFVAYYEALVILLLESFSHTRTLMVFRWNLRNNKLPQVSRTLICILTNFNNSKVWIVLICSLIPNTSSPISKPLRTFTNVPTAICIHVTQPFNSLVRSKHLSLF